MIGQAFYVYEHEQIVIATPLLSSGTFQVIQDELVESDFSSEKHVSIFKAYSEMLKNDIPFEPVSLADTLESLGLIGKSGGREYIFELLDTIITTAGLSHHIEEIKKARTKRLFAQRLSKANADMELGIPCDEIADELKEDLISLGGLNSKAEILTIKESTDKAMKDLELQESGKMDPGISTGFTDIDYHIGGLKPGELIIIAGRPGMGKTIWANNIAVNSKAAVIYFTLEMSSIELVKRKMSALGKINYQKIRNGKLKQDWEKAVDVANKLSEYNIRYIDKADCSISEIISMSKKLKDKYSIQLIIIDYLQLIKSNTKIENREREVADISRRLKILARNLEIPVVCLAQLNRQCEARDNKRPRMSDLRESGSLEQEADLIGFIYRDAVYKDNSNPHEAEFIIGKGRNVETGMVKLFFDGKHQTFEDWMHV